ncbi:MAG: flippase-like domain-containing protein [Deltaproteobacteria bacterium]|nr:flippase-like domain-containing protein [Deltaproteobacteria bacterium]
MDLKRPVGSEEPAARGSKLWRRVGSVVASTLLTGLAIYLLSQFVDLRAIPKQIIATDRLFFGVALALAVVFGLFATIHKWWLVLRVHAPSVKLREALFLRLGAAPLVVLMPLRSGEISTLLYLRRRHGTPYSIAIGTLLFDRAINLGSLLLLALVGALISDILPVWIPVLGLVLVALAFVPGLPDAVIRVLRLDRTRFAQPLANMLVCFRTTPPRMLALLALYGLVAQLGMSALFATCFLAYGVAIPWVEAVFLLAMVAIASNVQITVGGVGTREAVLLLLFAGLASEEQLVSASALFMTLESFLPALVGAVLMLPFFHRMLVGKRSSSPSS